jgi:hypothetical protein
MLRCGINPSLATPLNRHTGFANAFADRFDALGLQEKVVVDEIYRTIALALQLLELVDDMLRTA